MGGVVQMGGSGKKEEMKHRQTGKEVRGGSLVALGNRIVYRSSSCSILQSSIYSVCVYLSKIF